MPTIRAGRRVARRWPHRRLGQRLCRRHSTLGNPKIYDYDADKRFFGREDPIFEFNLRFPGQYFDKETNTHYNYFRDYDPAIGRYIQSDPIGLEGGVNTYLYANANPLGTTDANGLLSPLQHGGISLEAFEGTGFSGAFAWQVAKEAIKFDFVDGSQSIELAHTHGMTPKGGDPFASQAATESFINYQSRLCTPQGLGWALHAVQDKYARGHSGNREYGGLLRFEMIFHAIDDWLPSQDRRAAAVMESRRIIEQYQRLCAKECR